MPYFTLDFEENNFFTRHKGLKFNHNDFSRLLCMVLRKILIIFAHRIKLYVKYQP